MEGCCPFSCAVRSIDSSINRTIATTTPGPNVITSTKLNSQVPAWNSGRYDDVNYDTRPDKYTAVYPAVSD